jgi:exopolysaccharide biosynthesis polyprenyl glycosylphosphotransferase
VADVVAAAISLMLGTALFGSGRAEVGLLALVPLIVVMGKAMGIYDRDELVIRQATLDEASAVFQVATLYALIVWLVNGKLISGISDRRELLVLWGSLTISLLVSRAIARRLVRALTIPERCLVIGDSAACDRLSAKLAGRSTVHARIVAQVPFESVRASSASCADNDQAAEDLRSLVDQLEVGRIIVMPDRTAGDEVLNLVRCASFVDVKVSVVPGLFEVVGSSVEFDDVEGVPLLAVRRFRLNRSSQLVKRALDLLGALSAVTLLAPVMALIALAIKLDSRGPILFRQLRIGRDDEPFEILKFRTMVADADLRKESLRHLNEASGLFKILHDPRITRVGALLRRTSLDELPQLLNVIRGDMSLVGPRPLVAEEDLRIEGWHRRRLHLTPGMTGHWQILGSARIPLDEMVKIDYLYVTNWSLWTDVKILLRTIPYVCSRRGM